MTDEVLCSEGCGRPAKDAGRCWAHWKRLTRIRKGETQKALSEPVRPYGRTRWQVLADAALNYADAAAESHEEYERAKRQLIEAAVAYRERKRRRRRRGHRH